ncbi:MAG: transcriptional regulator, LacI family protein [Marmoricola sp.]|nr:transcriptional regulator, LacI family protein [Marmoricola sp.]
MLGVVFGLGHDFHAEVVDGIYAAAGDHGYEVVLSGVSPRRTESDAVRAVLAERCEAVVLIGTQLASRDIAELAGRLPTVSVLRQLRVPSVDVVRTDEAAGLEELVDHLHGLGHERIVHLDGGNAPGAAPRRRGYLTAMNRWGLEPASLVGGLTEESGAKAADQILAHTAAHRPTAVAAFNDRCALGLMHALIRRGLHVPEEVSVAGFDDIAAAGYAHVGLTTVRQDPDRLGQLAVDRLRHRLEGGTAPSPTGVVPATLMIRKTTAPPSA